MLACAAIHRMGFSYRLLKAYRASGPIGWTALSVDGRRPSRVPGSKSRIERRSTLKIGRKEAYTHTGDL